MQWRSGNAYLHVVFHDSAHDKKDPDEALSVRKVPHIFIIDAH